MSQVNDKIIDSIHLTRDATVGTASAVAMGMFQQVEAQSFAVGLQNAVSSQRGMQQVTEAIVAASCARLMQAMSAPPLPQPPPPQPPPPQPPVTAMPLPVR